MQVFLNEPKVELSSSAAERCIRLGACARKSFMFLNTMDSAHAFCDYMTIANTCLLNNVSIKDYILWLVANIKLKLFERQKSSKGDPTTYAMPNKQVSIELAKDKNGNDFKVTKTINMYDEANVTSYDKLDLSSLTPYDFAKLLSR